MTRFIRVWEVSRESLAARPQLSKELPSDRPTGVPSVVLDNRSTRPGLTRLGSSSPRRREQCVKCCSNADGCHKLIASLASTGQRRRGHGRCCKIHSIALASQRVAELEHKTKRREIDVSTINMLLTRKHADLREARQKVQSLEERLFLDRPSDHEAIAFLERNIAFHKTEVTRLSEEIERHEQALSEM